jgi:hypothetical protein
LGPISIGNEITSRRDDRTIWMGQPGIAAKNAHVSTLCYQFLEETNSQMRTAQRLATNINSMATTRELFVLVFEQIVRVRAYFAPALLPKGLKSPQLRAPQR